MFIAGVVMCKTQIHLECAMPICGVSEMLLHEGKESVSVSTSLEKC